VRTFGSVLGFFDLEKNKNKNKKQKTKPEKGERLR
jgi:hypothetical protein